MHLHIASRHSRTVSLFLTVLVGLLAASLVQAASSAPSSSHSSPASSHDKDPKREARRVTKQTYDVTAGAAKERIKTNMRRMTAAANKGAEGSRRKATIASDNGSHVASLGHRANAVRKQANGAVKGATTTIADVGHLASSKVKKGVTSIGVHTSNPERVLDQRLKRNAKVTKTTDKREKQALKLSGH